MTVFTRDRISLFAGGLLAAGISAGAYLTMNNRPADAATIGEQAPAFEERDSRGEMIRMSDFAGKIVVLEWTNDGCPFVQKQYASGNMQKTQVAAEKDGVVWISVVSSHVGAQGYVSGKQADKLTADRGAHPAHVILDADGSMGRAYGAKTTPHMFVISPDGKLAYQGAIDSIASSDVADVPRATNYVLAALRAVKEGKTPDPAVTRSYGCNVKY